MMHLDAIYSNKRTGIDKPSDDPRSEYQRDFDRLVFSSAFRRLQNKTQVFPLPGSVFVHNRLTHSLEVSSVGRSLGKIVGHHIAENCNINAESKEFYKYNLGEVIAAGCLAHDIGNPAFGHSGEKAISGFFRNIPYDSSLFSVEEWADLENFEGNANAIRVLTHQLKGKRKGGLQLTYSTLASIIKYPCEATARQSGIPHLKKYNFFQSDKGTFTDIAEGTHMLKEGGKPLQYARHPFVYLVEAADDICYRVIDFEDAHRLGILSTEEVKDVFLQAIQGVGRPEDDLGRIQDILNSMEDKNEIVTYLRAKTINTLTRQSADIFIQNLGAILAGTFNSTLFDEIKRNSKAISDIDKKSDKELYNHDTVVEIELAGYNIMYELLELLVLPVLKTENKRSHRDNKAIQLIPDQFGSFEDHISAYDKCMAVLDYVSGMTDLYATELYRKIKGIEFSRHR